MRVIKERITGTGEDRVIEEVDDDTFTHIHTCYHDEADRLGQARPCKRRAR